MDGLRRLIVGAIFFLSLSSYAQTQTEYLTAVNAISLGEQRLAMIQAGDHGINVSKYWTEAMENEYKRAGSTTSLKNLANKNFLLYLRDVSSGVVDPGLMGNDVKFSRKKFPTVKDLTGHIVATGYRGDSLVDRLAPMTSPYLSLKQSLRRINTACVGNQWQSLPAPKVALKLNVRDASVPAIKNRLRQYGYKVNTTDDLMDAETITAVNDIQWMLRFKPDGIISPGGNTFKYLNTPCKERVAQIQYDMEKLRWFPQTFGDRYIFVNSAMAYFSLMDRSSGTNYAVSTRTINGRPKRKTPTMQDKIVQVVINPYWIVPPTIFKEDKLEDIRGLSPWQIREYFDTRHYEVWNKDFTQKLDPGYVDWQGLGNGGHEPDVYIRQKPHTGNALGSLKFMLTNSFAIYLHDTNQPELFWEADRLLSSGCVRVQQPLDLAEYLLKGTTWDRTKIESTMAKPGQVMDKDTYAKVPNPMPVYIAYLTSQYSSDGVIRFVEDTYEMNSRIQQRGNW